jgi:hypothetical protein
LKDEFVGGHSKRRSEQKSDFCFAPGTWSGTGGSGPQFFDLSDQLNFKTPTDFKQLFIGRVNQQQQKIGDLHSEEKNAKRNIRTSNLNFNLLKKIFFNIVKKTLDSSTSTLVDFRPDIFIFSVKAPAILLVVSHDDPLGMDFMKERNNDSIHVNQLVQTIVNEIIIKSEHFFKIVKSLKFDMLDVNEQKDLLLNLYMNSHIRFN